MYELFADLCDKKGVTPYRVAKDCGFSNVTLSDWKNKGQTPKADKLVKIARYLGTTVEYLMTGEEPETSGSYYLDEEAAEMAEFLHKNPEYKTLFDASRKVRPEDIDFVQKMIERTSNYDD